MIDRVWPGIVCTAMIDFIGPLILYKGHSLCTLLTFIVLKRFIYPVMMNWDGGCHQLPDVYTGLLTAVPPVGSRQQ